MARQLPPELWESVIKHVRGPSPFDDKEHRMQILRYCCSDYQATLGNLHRVALSCRQLYRIARSLLYEILWLEWDHRGDCRNQALLVTLKRNPTLVSFTKAFRIHGMRKIVEEEVLGPLIPHMTQIVLVRICNCQMSPLILDVTRLARELDVHGCKWDRDDDLSRHAPLPPFEHLSLRPSRAADVAKFAPFITLATKRLSITPTFLQAISSLEVLRNVTYLGIQLALSEETGLPFIRPGYLDADPPLPLEQLELSVAWTMEWPPSGDVSPGNLPRLRSLSVHDFAALGPYQGHAGIEDLAIGYDSMLDSERIDLPGLRNLKLPVTGLSRPMDWVAKHCKHHKRLERLVMHHVTCETDVTQDFDDSVALFTGVQVIMYYLAPAVKVPRMFEKDPDGTRYEVLQKIRETGCPKLELIVCGLDAWVYQSGGWEKMEKWLSCPWQTPDHHPYNE